MKNAWPEIHSELNRRRLERVRNTPELAISAILRDDYMNQMPAEVVDFTSIGMRLRLREVVDIPSHLNRVQILLGKETLGNIKSFDLISWNAEKSELAISFPTMETTPTPRRSHRLKLRHDGLFRVQLVADDPAFAAQKIYFSILDVHSSGLSVQTSLRNKYLFPDSPLEACRILFPDCDNVQFQARVRNIRPMGESLRIGLEIVNPSSELKECLGQIGLLVHDYPATDSVKEMVEKIEAAGFSRKKISKAFSVGVVSNAEDYQRVLDLRWRAYLSAGKMKAGTSPIDMSDHFDARSTIIVLRLRDRVVATVRVVRCYGEEDRFPFEDYVSLPLSNRERLEGCELSRMAVDPGVKGTDLPSGLVQRMLEFALRGGARMGYCVATESLQTVYKRIGWKVASGKFPHPVLENEMMSLMRVNPHDLAAAEGIPALVWEAVYADVSHFLFDRGFTDKIPSPAMTKLRKLYEKNIMKVAKLLTKPKALKEPGK